MSKDENATKIGPGVYLHPNGDITLRTAIRLSIKRDPAIIEKVKQHLERGIASRLKSWIASGIEIIEEQPSEK